MATSRPIGGEHGSWSGTPGTVDTAGGRGMGWHAPWLGAGMGLPWWDGGRSCPRRLLAVLVLTGMVLLSQARRGGAEPDTGAVTCPLLPAAPDELVAGPVGGLAGAPATANSPGPTASSSAICRPCCGYPRWPTSPSRPPLGSWTPSPRPRRWTPKASRARVRAALPGRGGTGGTRLGRRGRRGRAHPRRPLRPGGAAAGRAGRHPARAGPALSVRGRAARRLQGARWASWPSWSGAPDGGCRGRRPARWNTGRARSWPRRADRGGPPAPA